MGKRERGPTEPKRSLAQASTNKTSQRSRLILGMDRLVSSFLRRFSNLARAGSYAGVPLSPLMRSRSSCN